MNFLRRFMAGRNGTDQLSLAILIVSIILNVVSGMIRIAIISSIVYSLAAAILIIGIFRILSRNIERRRAENAVFMRHWNKVRNYFRRQADKLRQSKTFRFFKCPACKNNLRVPKGKGKIYVTCPRCGERFIKKT